jgi:hypothetical protein
VDPLPDAVLERIYRQPEDDAEGFRRFMAAQALEGNA